MSRGELLVLRHAKSAWDTDAPDDFVRPLAPRGRRDCPRIGAWMAQHDIHPEVVLCSPAERAKETALGVLGALASDLSITFRKDLYLCGTRTWLAALADVPTGTRSVMLVGHNPGLDELVEHLADAPPPRAGSGKLMTTAALARFDLPADWSRLEGGCASLIDLIRPRELDD